jgi:hypothetical protein
VVTQERDNAVREGAPCDDAKAEEEESSSEWREPTEEVMPVVAAGRWLDMVAASLTLLALT